MTAMTVRSVGRSGKHKDGRTVKCLVWDLDNTIWDGVLSEHDQVSLRSDVVAVLGELDRRGILHSIASKCDHASAMEKLREFGLEEYFLYPQIGWGSKVPSIRTIAQLLNIGLDTIAFVDDQAFERDEVLFSLPDVLCLDATSIKRLPNMPEFKPRFVTADSRTRRLLYVRDIARRKAREHFVGAEEAFLASLGMVLTVFPAREEDLKRAEELTSRTNQLNSTGYTYSYDELLALSRSKEHQLLLAKLEDTYGSYGHIGLVLLECKPQQWNIKLLLTSCRVMSRGVGSVLLWHIVRLAHAGNVRLHAEFVPNGRNRVMNITYRLAGFRELERMGDVVIFEHDSADISPSPNYIELRVQE